MELPPDVAAYYDDMAARRGWPPDVRSAFLTSVAWYRTLDESDAPRRWFECVDREGLYDKGARLLVETVELVAVKQIDITSAGARSCYSWRRLEDDDGFLMSTEFDPAEVPDLEEIDRERFYAEWSLSV